jgi:hypothetical protein
MPSSAQRVAVYLLSDFAINLYDKPGIWCVQMVDGSVHDWSSRVERRCLGDCADVNTKEQWLLFLLFLCFLFLFLLPVCMSASEFEATGRDFLAKHNAKVGGRVCFLVA